MNNENGNSILATGATDRVHELEVENRDSDVFGYDAETAAVAYGGADGTPVRITICYLPDIAITACPKVTIEESVKHFSFYKAPASWKIERTGLRRIDKTLLRSARLPGDLTLATVLAVFPALQDAFSHGRELGIIDGEKKTQDAILDTLGIGDRLRDLEHSAKVAKNDLDDLWG